MVSQQVPDVTPSKVQHTLRASGLHVAEAQPLNPPASGMQHSVLCSPVPIAITCRPSPHLFHTFTPVSYPCRYHNQFPCYLPTFFSFTTTTEGKPIPSELRREEAQLRKEVELEDDNTAVPRSHIDDEYAHAGETDPKVLVTTSRDPSSRLIQFAKVGGPRCTFTAAAAGVL